ncbi:hypothetical protein AB7714_05675 [Tardiphaga sp. 1201_B9_N1_1]|uniref:hypothetical protein n=1 Tax=unclassified Tardiphaga TaxID=2631404 RepID=UPI003F26481F
MARFRCSECGNEGTTVYDPERDACPECGSTNVQVAVAVEELLLIIPSSRAWEASPTKITMMGLSFDEMGSTVGPR